MGAVIVSVVQRLWLSRSARGVAPVALVTGVVLWQGLACSGGQSGAEGPIGPPGEPGEPGQPECFESVDCRDRMEMELAALAQPAPRDVEISGSRCEWIGVSFVQSSAGKAVQTIAAVNVSHRFSLGPACDGAASMAACQSSALELRAPHTRSAASSHRRWRRSAPTT
jgi:hypothetical protein